MGNEAEQSLGGFVEAFGIVAGVSVGVAAVAALAARALRQPILPAWKVPASIWPGGIVLALFLGYYAAMPTAMVMLDRAGVYQKLHGADFPPMPSPRPADASPLSQAQKDQLRKENQLRAMWAGFVVVPLLCIAALVLRATFVTPPPRIAEWVVPLPGRVVFGVSAGLALVPITFGIHALTLWAAQLAGVAPDQHPLTLLRPEGDGYGGVVFALSVILVGPLGEEVLFRGLSVNWAQGEWHRPWILMAFAGFLTVYQAGEKIGPTAFVMLLACGLYAMQRFGFALTLKFPTRTASAVWSSAALFAAAHAPIWPTPIPLFALGLGLGYLTARCRDITAAVVVHGMFNAVSFLFLLRGNAAG